MSLEPKVADLLRDVVKDTARTTGLDFFRSLVRSLASLLEVRYCMVTECLDSPPTRVKSLAFWASDGFADNIEYGVLKTPCERVMLGESRCLGRDIRALYPDDADLVHLEAESYAAVPIFGGGGAVIGHLLTMDSQPMDADSPSLALLEIFAERAAAELERTRATAALERSEAQLRQVIDLVPHFIFAKNRDGEFILANEAVAEAYGTTVEGVLGKTDADFSASPEEAEGFNRDDFKVIDEGEVIVIDEETVTDATGRRRLLQTTKIPFTSAGLESSAMLGVAIDITRQRQLEEQRKNLQRQVQHAQKMESLGLLAGGIAHDFNNLLTSILGNVDLMTDSVEPDSPEQEYLAEISVA
ncbi:MAG: PAS domain-containing protein, partial [Planctomycetota bacterium]